MSKTVQIIRLNFMEETNDRFKRLRLYQRDFD